MFPRFAEVKAAGLDAGALGGGISGSGPSMFMLSTSRDIANDVAVGIGKVYSGTGLDFNIYVSEISQAGVEPV